MKPTIRFQPAGGVVSCLYTEAIDLRSIGRLEFYRATDIRCCDRSQRWNVRCASTGKLLHSDPSREACLVWDQENIAPPNPEVQRPANTLPNLNPITQQTNPSTQ